MGRIFVIPTNKGDIKMSIDKCAECKKLREQNERYRAALENYLQLLDSGWDFLDDENSLASIAREALKEVTDEK